MEQDDEVLQDLRWKRLQRAAEYALLITLHLFFLLAFHRFYTWWMALALAVLTFGMNFQLTQLRERRRTADVQSRPRVVADTFESILFLVFILLLSAGGALSGWLRLGEQEYLGYLAAVLGGLFLAGMLGEVYWQLQHFRFLSSEGRHNYVANLKRTIILPYVARRRENRPR